VKIVFDESYVHENQALPLDLSLLNQEHVRQSSVQKKHLVLVSLKEDEVVIKITLTIREKVCRLSVGTFDKSKTRLPSSSLNLSFLKEDMCLQTHISEQDSRIVTNSSSNEDYDFRRKCLK
jgi:hypothetical protein